MTAFISIYARLVRENEPGPQMSEQEKQEKRELIRKIQEDQAYSRPLEQVKELANRQLAEQSTALYRRGSFQRRHRGRNAFQKSLRDRRLQVTDS
jgi:hypothetical protein